MNPRSLAGACLCALLLPTLATAQSAPRPLLGGHGNNVQAFITQHDDAHDGRITAADFTNLFDERYWQWARIRNVTRGDFYLYGYATDDGIGRYSEPGRNLRATVYVTF
ncbi:hypothetical protein LL962_19580 [Xanthomonas sp. NCPPB 1067]|uniref:hypothetical protein n=1 Tax=Xanthomonas TaxID=338 RepID=UPI001E40E860|nr:MULTISPECIES: hypothetical protein [Xanthomonas]MCC4589275.1 hypothetical protein [Xanthomonas sp. NCPPB 1067]